MSSGASLEVRQRIRETYDKLARSTGIVDIDHLIEHLSPSGVSGRRTQLLVTLRDMPPFVVFDGRWVALIGKKQDSVLTKRLRQMLAVRNRLSLPTILAQLTRANMEYQHLPEEILRAFITAHKDFFLVDDRLESPAKLQPKTELDDAERFIIGALMFGPKSRDEIIADTRRPRKVTNALVLDALRKSVVFAVADDGRYSLINDSAVAATPSSGPEHDPSAITEPAPLTSIFSTQLSLADASAKKPPTIPTRVRSKTRSGTRLRSVSTDVDGQSDAVAISEQLTLGLVFEPQNND